MSEKGWDKAGVLIVVAILILSVGISISALLWAAHAYF